MRKIAFTLLLAGVALAAASCDKNKKVELLPKFDMPRIDMDKMFEGPTPEDKVRKQIADVLKDGDEARALRETAQLVDLAESLQWDSRRLLAAVLDYCGRLPADADHIHRYQRLLDRLYAPRTSIVDAAAERLERAEGKTDEVARSLLRFATTMDPREGRTSYANFIPYLDARRSQPPQKLVLWMYENDPGAAVLGMMSVFTADVTRDESKVILLAERAVGDALWKQRHHLAGDKPDPAAIDALGMLARFRPWWVRLYAAEILARNPALRTESLLLRLRDDENELVKQTIARAR